MEHAPRRPPSCILHTPTTNLTASNLMATAPSTEAQEALSRFYCDTHFWQVTSFDLMVMSKRGPQRLEKVLALKLSLNYRVAARGVA